MIQVRSVASDSIAAQLGITAGFELHTVNGRVLEDFLDWEFFTAEDRFVVVGRSPEGEAIEFDIERPEGEALGIELEPPRVRRCGNRCDFCFVDGLPTGLRETLYVRDDDYRLSFRYGNFATLTNLKPRDVDRILEYRLSPLYVSVHVTDPVMRRRLLRNPRAPAIVPQLEELAAGGIQFHTQIVLQPGVNDGEFLRRSLDDLFGLGESVLSVSVVPVGLTEFSKVHLVHEPTAAECQAAIALVQAFASRAWADRGHRWVYGSDDLYRVAGISLPSAEEYDGFHQMENGVGSVRFLQQRVEQERSSLPDLHGRRILVLTGTAMARLMPEVLRTLAEATGGTFDLVGLENDLFGPSVTSAGLLPGRAFQGAIRHDSEHDLALVPAEAVNDDGVFIDDLRFDDLEAKAPIDVRLSYDFADALTVEERS
jgi:putative radical SAM enzyme (TIGR03279 family)